MYKNIKTITIIVLIISVTILTLVSIMGIWNLLTKEVVERSLSTVAVLAFSSFVILVAANYLNENHKQPPSDKIGL